MAPNRRISHPGFQRVRLERALLVTDPSLAEILLGGWLMILRGIVLAVMGYAHGDVERLLHLFTVTADRMGFLLLAVGTAQILATATLYMRVRAIIAFCGSVLCGFIWVAYVGVDAEHSRYAWVWAALALSECVLSLRILLTRAAEESS